MKIDDNEYKFILNGKDYHCALDITMSFIGGKWKAVVLWYLRKEKKRFSELKERIPEITDKMLSTQLKSLEADGFISRTLYAEVPPRVEYEMTEEGRSLIPVLEAIANWGKEKARSEGKMVKL
ncbi:MAG: helix-turn-helix transcriptional regulator [Bacteroidetes bacterium]|nr:helix-turn-helix transcriptional regulator [Bacteroidota bacterium]MCB0851341.1 helix-turn-helix transcriptional regulator [Bacteroidota bacterium]